MGIADDPDPIGQMDSQVKKRRTLDAIKRVLLPESLNQPLIVIFERDSSFSRIMLLTAHPA